MIVFPHCKINIGLRIIRKRPDGYHDIETLFYPVSLFDSLEVVSGNNQNNEQASLINEGIRVDGDPKKNLVLKAYGLLAVKYNLPPVTFCLLKKIPMGAGLGGGSSDGAFTLKLLNNRFQLNLSQKELASLASQLGSDCAFFTQDLPCYGSGRGELMAPTTLTLKGNWICLIKPEIHLSTNDAYSRLTPNGESVVGSIRKIINGNLMDWKNNLVNDFEEVLFPRFPELAQIKERLYESGAWYASMSGSGSTIFGLFDKQPGLKDVFPDKFYYEAELG